MYRVWSTILCGLVKLGRVWFVEGSVSELWLILLLLAGALPCELKQHSTPRRMYEIAIQPTPTPTPQHGRLDLVRWVSRVSKALDHNR